MKKKSFFLVALLFLLSPFHALLITWLRHLGLSGNWNFVVSAWREILLVALFLITLPRMMEIVTENWRKFLKNYGWILLFMILPLFYLLPVLLPTITTADQSNTLQQWLWGARFDAPLFLAFLIFSFLSFSEVEKAKLLRIFLGVGFVVALFGLLHVLVLPRGLLTSIGYSVNRDIWDVSTAISSCQPLEHITRFCRAIATFGGPTRYGTYLLLLLSVGGFELIKVKIKRQKYFWGAVVFLSLANILFTFSRSIWIALFVMIVVALFAVARKRIPPLPWFKIGVTVAAIFLIFTFFTYNSWKTVFIRSSSSAEHYAKFAFGIEKLTASPRALFFGYGPGTSGPASLRGTSPLIVENQFLQIALEFGLIGLIIFLLAIYQIFNIRGWRSDEQMESLPIKLALAGLLVTGLFTHSLEETTTVIILGSFLGLQNQTHVMNSS